MKKNRRMRHRQSPTPSPKLHDDIRRRHFDPITATVSGGTVWRDYGNPHRIIVTRPGELPQDIIARDDKDVLCACGCGRPKPESGQRFIEGHKERMEQERKQMKLRFHEDN
jgi:hypothetical protein